MNSSVTLWLGTFSSFWTSRKMVVEDNENWGRGRAVRVKYLLASRLASHSC